MKYRVEWLIDNTYQVIYNDKDTDFPISYGDTCVYQGSLSDCEAYIRLKEGGCM